MTHWIRRIKNWLKKHKEFTKLERENKKLRDSNHIMAERLQMIYKHAETHKLLKIAHVISCYETNVKTPIYDPSRIELMNNTLNDISKIIAGDSDIMPFWRYFKHELDKLPIWR